MYPVSQAADIAVVKGKFVLVGHDQLPMNRTGKRNFTRF